MTEPTIEEMLEWVDESSHPECWQARQRQIKEAIRAILEQHEELAESARRWNHFQAAYALMRIEESNSQ